MARFWLVFLAGCGYVGEDWYETTVRDADGDGVNAVRFGGTDCQDDNPSVTSCDADGDGVLASQFGGDDCDDADATVYPGAPEICDQQDNDCDGAVDNDDADVVGSLELFFDRDGDGHGDPASPVACQAFGDGPLHVSLNDDCDDTDPEVNPSNPELCDGFDNDCNGVVDDVGLWFRDDDHDGFGVGSAQVSGSCNLEENTDLASQGGDCDDDDATVNPAAIEVPYDGFDQNCNGGRDDWDADFDDHVPAAHWPAAQAANQAQPPGLQWTLQLGDCDDTDPQRFVGNPEVCDGIDNDCDELIDVADLIGAAFNAEPALRAQVQEVFRDVDGDGHFGTPVLLCPADVDAALHSPVQDDCFDGGAPPPGYGGIDPTTVYVGADEICDGVDNDCDTRADFAFTAFPGGTLHYIDGDRDGIGAQQVFACAPSPGIAAVSGDCNDGEPTIYPGAPETCGDAIRQDCSAASVWDCDADGFEGSYVGGGSGDDCNDATAAVFPSTAPGAEVCDGIDNDCDGAIDSADLDNLDPTQPYWYADQDGDGYAQDAAIGLQQCDRPAGHVLLLGDCDDGDPTRSPATPWYFDGDQDGFGLLGSSVFSCLAPGPQWALEGGDCNDVSPTYNPDTRWYLDNDGDFLGNPSSESRFCVPTDALPWVLASNGVDCDDTDVLVQGSATYYADEDGDGHGDPNRPVSACAAPIVGGIPYVSAGGDCNDLDASIGPDRPELCNAIDDDCDGFVDDADPGVIAPFTNPLGYRDLDGDGFGTDPKNFCFAVPSQGWALNTGDCDDGDGDVFPGQIEICANGVDDDCDGLEQIPNWFADTDGDGFGTGSIVAHDCSPPLPTGFTTTQGDCDDTNALIFPGAGERDRCDAIDDNCDGAPEPRLTWYFDQDRDGFGDDAYSITTCVPPTSPPEPGLTGDWVLSGGDCDDDETGITFGRIWYLDRDGDGLGDAASTRFACSQYDQDGEELNVWLTTDVNGNGLFEPGDVQLSVFSGDCYDTNAAIGPSRTYFRDDDGDTYGAAGGIIRCPNPLGGPPTGTVIRAGDCNDADATVSPAAIEIDGDGRDSNCDGLDDTETGITWYPDEDGDGLGDLNVVGTTTYLPGYVTNHADCDDTDASVLNGLFVFRDLDLDTYGAGFPLFVGGRCSAIAGESLVATDCDDGDSAVRPGAPQIACDGIDNNCTGLAITERDRDLDGYLACEGDCDDLSAARNPGMVEICDGIVDNDCLGGPDDDRDDDGDGWTECTGDDDDNDPDVAPGLFYWYPDVDGDGLGDSVSVGSSAFTPGWVTNRADCDDADASVLNGRFVYDDLDSDGFGGGSLRFRGGCALLPGETANGDDCDDTRATISPAAIEVCDGRDTDCDGELPDDEADLDGDGVSLCNGDPDDGDANISPSSGRWYPDADGDNYGDASAPGVLSTTIPPGHVGSNTDCDDTDARTNPGMFLEFCDGKDNNCDGLALNGDPDVTDPTDRLAALIPENAWVGLADLDGDGRYSLGSVLQACSPITDPSTLTRFGGSPILVRALEGFGSYDEVADCDDGSGTDGTVYLWDEDGDGVGGTGEIGELSCDGSPPRVDWVEYAGSFDCDDQDADRAVEVQAGEFGDVDADGFISAVSRPGNCAAAVSDLPGDDCDDDAASGTPNLAHRELDAFTQADLDGLLAACDTDLTLRIHGSQTLDGAAFADNTRYEFVEGEGFGCLSRNGCLDLAGVFVLDGVDLTFREIELDGAFEVAATNSTVTIQDSRLDDFSMVVRDGLALTFDRVTAFSTSPEMLTVEGGSLTIDASVLTGSNVGIRTLVPGVSVVDTELAFGASALWIEAGGLDATDVVVRSSGSAVVQFGGSFVGVRVDVDAPEAYNFVDGAVATCSGCTLRDSNLSGSPSIRVRTIDAEATFTDVRAPNRLSQLASVLGYLEVQGARIVDVGTLIDARTGSFVELDDVQVGTAGIAYALEEGAQVFVTDSSFAVLEQASTTGAGDLRVTGLEVVTMNSGFYNSTGELTLRDAQFDFVDQPFLTVDQRSITLLENVTVQEFQQTALRIGGDADVTIRHSTLLTRGAENAMRVDDNPVVHLDDVVMEGEGNLIEVAGAAPILTMTGVSLAARGSAFTAVSGSPLVELSGSVLISQENSTFAAMGTSRGFYFLDDDELFGVGRYALAVSNAELDVQRTLLWTENVPTPLVLTDTNAYLDRVSVVAPDSSSPAEMGQITGGTTRFSQTLFHRPNGAAQQPILTCVGVVSIEADRCWTDQPDLLIRTCPELRETLPNDGSRTGAPEFHPTTHIPLNGLVRHDYGHRAN